MSCSRTTTTYEEMFEAGCAFAASTPSSSAAWPRAGASTSSSTMRPSRCAARPEFYDDIVALKHHALHSSVPNALIVVGNGATYDEQEGVRDEDIGHYDEHAQPIDLRHWTALWMWL